MDYKLAVPLVIALSLVTGTGTYTFHELVQYIEKKTPGNQTLLDRIYVQQFKMTAVRNLLIGIVSGLLIVGLELPWFITTPLGWCDIFMRNLVGIHLFVCLIVKMLLIYKPQIVEEISDDTFCFWSW